MKRQTQYHTTGHAAFTRPTLTPFDRLMIDEAYARCYGLREAVQRGDLAELAHQTGFRVEYLQSLSNAVIAHSEEGVTK